MNVWRWLGTLVFMAGLMVLVGANISAIAQDKKDETKKDETKKDETKKDEAKKDEAKKDEAKKDEAKKDEGKKDDAKKDDAKKDDAKKDEKKEEPRAPVKADHTRLEWKAFEPKYEVDAKTGKKELVASFYQVLETNTTQDMKVMGQEISQKQNQTFYLKWTPEEKKDGNYVVTQEIIGLKMSINIGGTPIAYDSTEEKQAQNPMSDFFKALIGLKLKLTISPKMQVVNIEGQDDFVRKLGGANQQMEPLLKSILSKEALKQMAEPTWGALPDQDVKTDSKWGAKEPSKLDLGPIGTYFTTFSYTYEGVDKDKKQDKIGIKSELKYQKPDPKASPALPFTIKDATLASKEGSGVAYFDQAKGRFSETTMKMKLEGDLTIEVGGMDTKVSLTQVQDAKSTTSDEQPAALTAKKKQ